MKPLALAALTFQLAGCVPAQSPPMTRGHIIIDANTIWTLTVMDTTGTMRFTGIGSTYEAARYAGKTCYLVTKESEYGYVRVRFEESTVWDSSGWQDPFGIIMACNHGSYRFHEPPSAPPTILPQQSLR